MFTTSNTEGFTQAQIDILNAARTIVAGQGDIPEDHIDDAINNAWVGEPDDTAQDIADRVMRQRRPA